jgi:PHP family Zn ribbon phosphoesterase
VVTDVIAAFEEIVELVKVKEIVEANKMKGLEVVGEIDLTMPALKLTCTTFNVLKYTKAN